MYDNVYFIETKNGVTIIDIYNRKFEKFSKKEISVLKKYLTQEEFICCEDDKELINKWTDFINNEEKIRVKKEKQDINPLIIPSYMCNYSCDYCYQKQVKNRQEIIESKMIEGIDLFYDDYCDFFNIKKKYGKISIIGGEPLLVIHKSTICKIFETWKNRSFIITTNGVNLVEYSELFKDKDIEFHISLDGVKKTHFRRRHADLKFYDKTIEGIKWAIKNNKKVVIMSLFEPCNIEEYIEFFDLLEELGWLKNKNIRLHFNLQITKGCDSITNEELDIANSALMELIKLDNRVLYADISSFIPGMNKLTDIINKTQEQGIYRCGCLATPSYSFLPNGKVSICSMLYKESAIIGQYYPKVKVDYDRIIEFKKRNVLNMSKCKNCSKALLCRGGCLVTAMEEMENVYHPICGIWNEEKIFRHFERIYKSFGY